MLLRISLIVAIVAGIATFVISHTQLATKIATLQSDLATTQAALATSQEAERKASADAKAANERADRLDRELSDTKENLELQTSRANTQQNRADRLEGDLNKTRGELTEAQRNLAAWRALGIPVEQVRERLAALERATVALAGMTEENKVLLDRVQDLQVRLDRYEGGADRPPEMDLARNGKVLAVNPQWDFIVVDLGSNEGAVERGEMLVNRDGKLVAKVRISRVEETQCVANVMAEWKQADVAVGDVVLK
jgi:chromosome segregation ATPase